MNCLWAAVVAFFIRPTCTVFVRHICFHTGKLMKQNSNLSKMTAMTATCTDAASCSISCVRYEFSKEGREERKARSWRPWSTCLARPAALTNAVNNSSWHQCPRRQSFIERPRRRVLCNNIQLVGSAIGFYQFIYGVYRVPLNQS